MPPREGRAGGGKGSLTSVDHPTIPMHIIEAEQYLLRDLLDEVHRHTFVLVTPDQAKEVLAEHLKDHADMDAVGAAMAEMIEELDDMPTPWVTRRRFRGNDAL